MHVRFSFLALRGMKTIRVDAMTVLSAFAHPATTSTLNTSRTIRWLKTRALLLVSIVE